MLFTPNDEHPAGFRPSSGWGRHASVANGVLGTIVDSGTVFLSGVFNGPDMSTTKAYPANFSNPGARPHLAMVPSNLAMRITNATVYACAIDLLRGMYLRRSNVAGAQVEQRWYADNGDNDADNADDDDDADDNDDDDDNDNGDHGDGDHGDGDNDEGQHEVS